jgi:hypothetical protein
MFVWRLGLGVWSFGTVMLIEVFSWLRYSKSKYIPADLNDMSVNFRDECLVFGIQMRWPGENFLSISVFPNPNPDSYRDQTPNAKLFIHLLEL